MITFLAAIYFLVGYYFKEKVSFRAFEECLSVVSDPPSNWITRKGIVNFCLKEIR